MLAPLLGLEPKQGAGAGASGGRKGAAILGSYTQKGGGGDREGGQGVGTGSFSPWCLCSSLSPALFDKGALDTAPATEPSCPHSPGPSVTVGPAAGGGGPGLLRAPQEPALPWA